MRADNRGRWIVRNPIRMVRGGRTEGVGMVSDADRMGSGRAHRGGGLTPTPNQANPPIRAGYRHPRESGGPVRVPLDSRLRGNDAAVRFGPAAPLPRCPAAPLPRCLPPP
jgi:hypothetical protein